MPEFQVTLPDDQPQDNNKTENPVPTAFSDVELPLSLTETVEEVKPEEVSLPDKICTHCLERNLVQAGIIDTFKSCSRCNEQFCQHGASKLDPQYCVHCCNDFKVVDAVETQQRPLLNAKGDVIGVRHFKVRHLTLSGMDWLFFNRAIATMSDVELEHAIEYHLSFYHGLIYEREARRVKRAQRNKGKTAGNETRDLTGSTANPFVHTQDGVLFALDPDGANAKKKPRTVKTRSVKVSQSSINGEAKAAKPKAQQNVNDLVAILLKAGMTQEQIMALGKK